MQEVLGDHPDVTAVLIVAAIQDPQAVWEHPYYQDSLVYDRTVRLPARRSRLMVITDQDAPASFHVVTAFFPAREGHRAQNVGRWVWPDAG